MSGDVHVRFCESGEVRLLPATHLVVLVDGRAEWSRLVRAAYRRLVEETVKLDVTMNEEKTRVAAGQAPHRFGLP